MKDDPWQQYQPLLVGLGRDPGLPAGMGCLDAEAARVVVVAAAVAVRFCLLVVVNMVGNAIVG